MTLNLYSSHLHIHFPQIRHQDIDSPPNFPCRIWGKPEGGPHDQPYLLAEKKIETTRHDTNSSFVHHHVNVSSNLKGRHYDT